MEEAAFPCRTKQFAVTIDGIHTEFILSSFSDYLFFTITQLGKLGTLTRSELDVSVEGGTTYTVQTLLGKRDIETELYSRKLVELTSKSSKKPLLLALGLKSSSPTLLKAILENVEANIEKPEQRGRVEGY